MGHDLSPDEQFALEAIIIPDKRPAIDVVDGDYHVAHPLWTYFESDAGIHQRLRQVIPSIGRVELPGHPTIPYAGTGFVVGDELLMTNRHVAEIFADGLGTRAITFKPGYSSGIDFKQERNRPAKLFLKAIEVVMIHPYWDMALLRVAGLSPAQAPLVLSLRNPEELVDHDIAVIGYPAFDVRNPADVQNKVFDGVYYVKRLQPGKLKPRERVDSFGNRVLAAAHDSSTLGGNSGSAVFDVATGQVIALHFGGSYLKSNFGVPTFELARDARVIATKVKFDTGAKAQPIEWEEFMATHGHGIPLSNSGIRPRAYCCCFRIGPRNAAGFRRQSDGDVDISDRNHRPRRWRGYRACTRCPGGRSAGCGRSRKDG